MILRVYSCVCYALGNNNDNLQKNNEIGNCGKAASRPKRVTFKAVTTTSVRQQLVFVIKINCGPIKST